MPRSAMVPIWISCAFVVLRTHCLHEGCHILGCDTTWSRPQTVVLLVTNAVRCLICVIYSNFCRFKRELCKLTVPVERICKVVPHRIYSMAVHPTENKLVVAVGDKWGNLGMYQQC
jgi:hypothetical protein